MKSFWAHDVFRGQESFSRKIQTRIQWWGTFFHFFSYSQVTIFNRKQILHVRVKKVAFISKLKVLLKLWWAQSHCETTVWLFPSVVRLHEANSKGPGVFFLGNSNFRVVQQRIHGFAHKWNQRRFTFHLMSFRWWLNSEQ